MKNLKGAQRFWGILLGAIMLGSTLVPNFASAAAEGEMCDSDLDCNVGLSCVADKCVKDVFGLNPVDEQIGTTLGNEDLRTTVGRLINVALSMLGIIAVIIVLAGGFKWMTAGGNDDKVAEAKKMIISGVIGLAIILSAWAIALFVLNQLNKATSGGTDNIPDIE